MLTWQFAVILGPRRLGDFELTATKKAYLALTANRNHSSLSFRQAPHAPTRIFGLGQKRAGCVFSLKTAFNDTSNLDRLSPTQPRIPPRIFQNSATGHKSLGRRRRRLCAAVFKRDLQALCRTWDSEWRAALCSGVLRHRLNGEQESEAPGVARRVLPTTWCHIPSPHGRLRCGAINWAAHFHVTSRAKLTTNVVALLVLCLLRVFRQNASRIKKRKYSNCSVCSTGQYAIFNVVKYQLINWYVTLLLCYFCWVIPPLPPSFTCSWFSILIEIICWVSIWFPFDSDWGVYT